MTRSIALAAAATLLAVPLAKAEPPQDTANIFTFQVENDAVSTFKGTSDQYYTSGLRLGWTSGTNQVPAFLQHFANAVWGDGVQRISLDISQSIFTPRDTQAIIPPAHDRPYAAILGVTGALIHDTDRSRTVLALELGAIGPIAQGEEVQNGFHNIIGDTSNQGWSSQLRNEPIFEITPSRTWRVDLGHYNNVEFDALPSLTAGFGNLRNYVQVGGIMRFGQGLHSDFGAARILPGVSGSDAFTPTQPLVWYVFGGLDGQLVGTDITLNGNTFASGPHVGPRWYVGELEAGAAVIWHGVRLSYTQTWQTPEFTTQKAGLFNFGSFAMSVRF